MQKFFQKIQSSAVNLWPPRVIKAARETELYKRTELFRSARLRLTGFYMVILIIFSLVLTLSLRSLAGHTFDRAGEGDRGIVKQLFNEYYSVAPEPNLFNQFQNYQSANVHRDLDQYVIIINTIAIIVGGVVSYWYAGRTLKPIQNAHETQARFAADASHELRTPLTALRVENEVFLHQKNAKLSEARELLKSNLEEAHRLENLAGTLLALTQYEQATLELNAVVLKDVISSAQEHIDKAAKARRIKFVVNIPDKAKVMGEFDSLVQLVGIILDNAVKFGKSNSEAYIDAVKRDSHYYLSVRDKGNGIPEEDLPFIFDRLYRGDKSRASNTPGYGLGLSLAREIARVNRADITARNYPTGGAQFVISLVVAKN